MRRTPLLAAACAALLTLTACSDDGSASPTPTDGAGSTDGGADTTAPASTVDLTGRCEVGSWVSTGMTAPSQGAVGDVTPTGGGDGMNITFRKEGVFQIDFGPMKPLLATFQTAGQQGTLSTFFGGVGKGPWVIGGDGSVMATFEDMTTAKAVAVLTLGNTVPPIFDESLDVINDKRMLGGEKVGVFTVSCTGDTMTLTTPFPNGEVEIQAARQPA